MEKEKTKRCRYCKTEIPADAKVCPQCRKKQGIRIWQVVVAVLVVLVVAGALAGGSSGPQAVTGTSEPASGQSEAAGTPAQQAQKTEFSQGETVDLEQVEYTVTGVERTPGTEYDQAREGYEYVIVSIAIENQSDRKISYNPLDWKMVNGNGQEESVTFTIVDTDTALSSGDLNPGGKVEGTITFEEPQGDTALTLNYYASLMSEQPDFQIKLDAQ